MANEQDGKETIIAPQAPTQCPAYTWSWHGYLYRTRLKAKGFMCLRICKPANEDPVQSLVSCRFKATAIRSGTSGKPLSSVPAEAKYSQYCGIAQVQANNMHVLPIPDGLLRLV